jgi:alpha-L-rhamnosidase
MLPNGKINSGEMTPFNHYALGAVADWMHRDIGGLEASQQGWEEAIVRPRTGGSLAHATTKHESPYGMISSSWKLSGNDFSLKVVIPPNVTAKVLLPDSAKHSIGSGSYEFTSHLVV